MNLRDFDYFFQLSQLNSYTAVAKHFGVSQPTITYAIKRLEEQFNCHLIIKDPAHRTVELTQEGLILARHIEQILIEVSVAHKEIKRYSQKKLTIGFPPIIRARIISKLLNHKKDLSFLSNFDLHTEGSKFLLQELLNGELDFSFIGSHLPLEHPNLEIFPLYKREFYIFVSEKHPLADRKEISFKELLDQNFIMLDSGHTHYDVFNQLNQQYHNQAKVIFELNEVSLVGQLVKENIGITLLTDFVLFTDTEGLVKIPLVESEKQYFHVSYAYPKNAVLSPDLENLISILEDIKTNQKSLGKNS
ncbi:LysR family transcriptional regulator [Streptococcus loxodontisalivarius]|uniref:DNA-binding transcriptional LysR family regulator n=1 Tax=Streptococcus loxodontisalivarius TaxID=1349415 RepID=A0ABS2PR15_9STRE|nr:LysR family transcriptional regulator [Streptococcus loxodontisalivarius]MBM7642356.1 DNA-binding transcriptional LysR family regulator [Streptococcus loxodontisalivarius]